MEYYHDTGDGNYDDEELGEDFLKGSGCKIYEVSKNYDEHGIIRYDAVGINLNGKNLLLEWDNTKIKDYYHDDADNDDADFEKYALYNHIEYTDEKGVKIIIKNNEGIDDKILKKILTGLNFPLEIRPIPEKYVYEEILKREAKLGEIALQSFLQDQQNTD